jgi:hypothetical protein
MMRFTISTTRTSDTANEPNTEAEKISSRKPSTSENVTAKFWCRKISQNRAVSTTILRDT